MLRNRFINITPILLLICIFLFADFNFPQTDYIVTLEKVTKVNEFSLEFEVTISSGHEVFILTSYQCTFLFNSKIVDGERLSFGYIKGTSQLTNSPIYGVGINDIDKHQKLTFASWAGSDVIANQKLRIGRFRLQTTNQFQGTVSDITWCFDGNASTILTGDSFQNITIPANFQYDSKKDNNPGFAKSSSNNSIPDVTKLLQNYPNPFNPSTKISFQLIEEANVKLEVYNSLGQQVSILLDEQRSPGIHTVDFNGESLPSGIYFYKLKANGKLVNSMKMILLR